MKRLILIGNPNVGKSALFTRLTGVHTTISNYPGTTVTFTSGYTMVGGEMVEVVDTPGSYSVNEPGNEAEKVAADLLLSGDVIINVADATNLERNLLLTMQLLERGLPVVMALNMFDDAGHKGIRLDLAALREFLRIPVLPTVALSGDGIRELMETVAVTLQKRAAGTVFPRIPTHDFAAKWADIGQLIRRVQSLEHRHHTFLETLQDLSVHPVFGLVVAVAVLAVVFGFIRLVGEGLVHWVFDPFFTQAYLPLMQALSGVLEPLPLLQHLLIGVPIHGAIDFEQSMGMLTTGVYVELAVVLPYLVAFYAVLSLLEDMGYLPRLGVLLDALMHRLGLHGFSVIPILLGFGCNVPGILATRSLETRRQRFIACTLISIGVPCVSLQAMIFKLVGRFGFHHVLIVYLYLGLVTLCLGLMMKQLVRGFSPEMMMEIPPYRRPSLRLIGSKLLYRVKGFLMEATPLILFGILLMNLLDYFGVFHGIAAVAGPLVRMVWGLPETAILPIVMGFLRKDVAAGMLVPLGLTLPQVMTACTLLALTFPCIATFIVLFAELGWRDTLKSIGVMLVSAVVFGGLAHLVFHLYAG